MLLPSARFYHPQAVEKVAVLTVQPVAGHADAFVVRTQRGVVARKLLHAADSEPFPAAQTAERFAAAEAALKQQGYFRAGVHALLHSLQSTNSLVRGRAAARLGWLRSVDAVDALLTRLPQAIDDACPIVDALGAIGDPRVVPALRLQAERKLLSRRRSAVEALRNLNDAQGLAEARQRAIERLPDVLRPLVPSSGEAEPNSQAAANLSAALLKLELSVRGLALDTLYEIGTPSAVAAVRAAIRQTPLDRPHVWRYVKSILKRSMLRHDHATFGDVSHLIEVCARTSTGTTASVKSGYDGVQRTTPIFRPDTQRYVLRSTWRYLRMLAQHRPDAYAHAAAEALIHYTAEDGRNPRRLHGTFSRCYMLHRIVWGGSRRFVYDDRRLCFRFRSAKQQAAPLDEREEAYPELWDAQPRALLRVLGAARLQEVQVFALKTFLKTGKHRATLAAATLPEILALLQAPYQPTVALGLEEIERRFNPAQPDWTLLDLLLADERPATRQLGMRFLRLCAALWTRQPERIVEFLGKPHPELRELVLELVLPVLAGDAALRRALAERVLAMLCQPEVTEGAHEGLGILARAALQRELAALLDVPQLADLILRGSPAAQSLAGELLQHRPEAIAELGLERLVALAQHAVAAVRLGAHALLRSALEPLQRDPAPLFVLVESDWPDTRQVAFDLLRRLDIAALGFDGLLGLLDSNRVDVQDMGQELARQHLACLPTADLAERLTQHPHPHMRAFALQLVEQHLPTGHEPLARLRRFFRTAFLDLRPRRAIKRRMVDFLLQRGLQDTRQAEAAALILGDVLRLHGRADAERALEALVRLKLAFPEIDAAVVLWPGGAA
ncbi:MAG: hypothetical protein JNM56_32410 [Planctomycetia bacterium]|nr:hypothetical protein [Planctomycetia bacterium]